MCYRFATNPSIHHHRHHIAAVSSPLSHYGVAFTSVAVSSLPSQCRLRHRIVTVLLSLSCHCGAFAVALLWFHRPHRSVAFVVALLWFRRRHHGVTFMFVTVLSLLSRCRLHVGRGFVFAIMVSPSRWSQFCHCHRGVAFVVASSRCHRHSCIHQQKSTFLIPSYSILLHLIPLILGVRRE